MQHMYDSALTVARRGHLEACASRGCAKRFVRRVGLRLLLQESVMGVVHSVRHP